MCSPVQEWTSISSPLWSQNILSSLPHTAHHACLVEKKHNSKYVIKVRHKTADVSVNTPSENINICVNSWTVYLNRILNLEAKRIQNSFPPSASQTLPLIAYRSGRLNSEYCTSRGILLQSRSFIIKVGQLTMPPFTPHTGFLQTSSTVQCSIKEKNHHRSRCSCFYWELTTPPTPTQFPRD